MNTQTWKLNPTLAMMAVTAVVLVLGTAWAGQAGVTTRGPASGQHVDHVAGGTAATDLKPAAASQGKVRRYYLAAEEVLWRGYAFGALASLGGRRAAVLATAVLFAVYHPYGPLDTLSVGIIGLFLGVLRAAGAGLVALSVGHFL